MVRLKYVIEAVLALLIRVFHLLPLKRKQVFFSAFSGRQYSDSPKRISEYLLNVNPEIKQVWAFCEPEKFAFLKEKGITVVKYKSFAHIKYALTSKVYVDNVEFWSLLRFRKSQMVVETWHGGGAYKRIGGDRIDVGGAERRHAVDKMNRTTLFLSSSTAFTENVINTAYHYKGDVLEVGLPRNDELMQPHEEFRAEMREKLGLSTDAKVVIYAPTFRNSHNTELYNVDFKRLRESLSARFGGEWIVLLRMHYYIAARLKGEGDDKAVIDVSDYSDMQDLLRLADVLVTDYSSTVWDFSLMHRPCFLYATDVEDYQGERNFYMPIGEWPFPLAENNDQLEKIISTFDEVKYLQDVEHHHDVLGSRETGEATKRTCEKIIEFIGG